MTNNAPRARAIRGLKDWISSGVLAPGSPLPAERALSEKLDVPRATVRRAIQVLESEGLIRSTDGLTRMVADADDARHAGVMKKTVIVLAPSAEQDPRHIQPGWTDRITQGILDAVRGRGLHAMLLNPSELGVAEMYQIADDRPKGVLIPEVFRGLHADPTAGVPLLKRLKAKGVPAVVYGGDPRLAPFNRVMSDHTAGARAVTRWLLDQGRRRPLLLVEKTQQSYWVADRRRGYASAMDKAGLEPHVLEIPAFPDERTPDHEFFETVSRYVAGCLLEVIKDTDPIDAIVAMSDGKVFPIVRALQLLGKRVHDEVAVVGYDNYWGDSWEREFIDAAPLATIDKQNFEMGRAMVELLLDRCDKPHAEPISRVIQPRLVADVS